MSDWQIVILHTRRNTLLKRSIEAAFPGRVASIHVPALRSDWYCDNASQSDVLSYFRRNVYDSGLWNGRVLTIYGDGEFHHYTYALTRLAAERRGLESPDLNWTYFHLDNHRDDWGHRPPNGYSPTINCANFVDSIAYDHGAVPFMIGPQAYPKKDSRGYRIRGTEIPIYSNYFTKDLQESWHWPSNAWSHLEYAYTGVELPSTRDLRDTPIPTYLSFDLDVLAQSEIVTNFDQNEHMTLRRLCQILDRIKAHKRVFSADILGFPDTCHHPLSILTVIILARKVMGFGIKKLLAYHGWLKQKQSASITNGYVDLGDQGRKGPIEEEELMAVIQHG